MARFKIGEENNFGGNGGGGFFSLRNDGDTARVRFLYDSVEDVEGFAVHQVEVNGKKRYVNCIREAGDSKDVCPLCAANQFVTAKFFIPLYNVDEDRTMIWERGKQFGSKLGKLCARYPHLVQTEFEIERNGKPRDTNTTYEIYPGDKDDSVAVEDFEEVKILGGLVIDATADDMDEYLNTGSFSCLNNNSGDEDVQPRRSRQREERASSHEDDRPARRTPGRRGSGDSF